MLLVAAIGMASGSARSAATEGGTLSGRICDFADCGGSCICPFDTWYPDERLRYGYGMTADTAAAAYWYRRDAKRGDVRAAYNLALLLRDGANGPPQPKRAQRLLIRAADGGITSAHLALGNGYRLGAFGAVDTGRALRHYREAAAAGLVTAQHALGNMLANGLGTSRDRVQAYKWWRVASWKGARLSEHALDRLAPLLSYAERRRGHQLASDWLAVR